MQWSLIFSKIRDRTCWSRTPLCSFSRQHLTFALDHDDGTCALDEGVLGESPHSSRPPMHLRMVAEHDCAQAMGVKSDLEGRRQSPGSLAHYRQCGGRERAQWNEQQAVFAKEYAAIVEADLFQIYDGILTLMKEKFDSEEDVACEIRCYTSETKVADVLEDATQGEENFIEIKKRRQRTVEEIVEMPVPQIHGQIDEVAEVICLVRRCAPRKSFAER